MQVKLKEVSGAKAITQAGSEISMWQHTLCKWDSGLNCKSVVLLLYSESTCQESALLASQTIHQLPPFVRSISTIQYRERFCYCSVSPEQCMNQRMGYRLQQKGANGFSRLPHSWETCFLLNNREQTDVDHCPDSFYGFINRTFSKPGKPYLLNKLGLFITQPIKSMAPIGDPDGRTYCSNRANSLNPRSGLLFHAEELQHYKQCPAQCTNSQKSPHHPDAGHLHAWHLRSRHVQWPLATLFPVSLPSHGQHVQSLAAVVAVEHPARPSSLPDARPAGVRRV